MERAIPGSPETNPEAAREVFTKVLPGMIVHSGLFQRLGKMLRGFDLGLASLTFAADLIDRMAPGDPVEEMLVVQMILTHVRAMHLSEVAMRQEKLESVRVMHEYADRASNTYRRLMLALAEYRRPPRAGDNFTAIKQANIAGQQVIQNHENKDATNELGCTNRGAKPETSPALPTDAERTRNLADLRPLAEAVVARHRAANPQRKGKVQ